MFSLFCQPSEKYKFGALIGPTQKKDKYRREGKGCHCCFAILHQDNNKKNLIRIMALWRNGCVEKGMIPQFQLHKTTTLPKWLFSKKPSFKSSLLRYSSTSPNPQRRLLPSLLYLSFFYGNKITIEKSIRFMTHSLYIVLVPCTGTR